MCRKQSYLLVHHPNLMLKTTIIKRAYNLAEGFIQAGGGVTQDFHILSSFVKEQTFKAM